MEYGARYLEYGVWPRKKKSSLHNRDNMEPSCIDTKRCINELLNTLVFVLLIRANPVLAVSIRLDSEGFDSNVVVLEDKHIRQDWPFVLLHLLAEAERSECCRYLPIPIDYSIV
jgi:hypothetical protein